MGFERLGGMVSKLSGCEGGNMGASIEGNGVGEFRSGAKVDLTGSASLGDI